MALPKNKLESFRRKNFLSQSEIASLVGMSQAGYQKIELGERKLSIDLARKLVSIYELKHIEELLEEMVS